MIKTAPKTAKSAKISTDESQTKSGEASSEETTGRGLRRVGAIAGIIGASIGIVVSITGAIAYIVTLSNSVNELKTKSDVLSDKIVAMDSKLSIQLKDAITDLLARNVALEARNTQVVMLLDEFCRQSKEYAEGLHEISLELSSMERDFAGEINVIPKDYPHSGNLEQQQWISDVYVGILKSSLRALEAKLEKASENFSTDPGNFKNIECNAQKLEDFRPIPTSSP